jgi:DNA-binding MarR family transcriptional regulator
VLLSAALLDNINYSKNHVFLCGQPVRHMSDNEKSNQKSTGYWVTRLARSMERDFDQRLKPLGITRGSYAVLSAVHHDEKNTPAELAAHLGLDGAAITRYLDRVEELGLLERKPNAADRRSIHLELTADGRRAVSRGYGASRATNEKFTAVLKTAEIDCFQTAIRKMLENSDVTIAGL